MKIIESFVNERNTFFERLKKKLTDDEQRNENNVNHITTAQIYTNNQKFTTETRFNDAVELR